MKAEMKHITLYLAILFLLLPKASSTAMADTHIVSAVSEYSFGAISLKSNEERSAWTHPIEGSNSAIVSLLEKADTTKDYSGLKWEGNISNQKAEFVSVVETSEEWSELWRRAFEERAPDVDFEKYVEACVFLGYSAAWLYEIIFGTPYERDNRLVIPFSLVEVYLRLSGPFKAAGQYHMKVYAKRKDVKMILEESPQSSRRINLIRSW